MVSGKKLLIAFQEILHQKDVLVFSSNSTMVAYLNNQGGKKSLSLWKVAQEILPWAEARVLSLAAVHIRDVLNAEVDFLSRKPIRQGN